MKKMWPLDTSLYPTPVGLISTISPQGIPNIITLAEVFMPCIRHPLTIGLAINPTLVEGQIQGAISQGIGWALMENYVFEKGVLQNATFLDYRMPTATNLPFMETLLVEVRSDTGTYGIRPVGEPPMVPTLATIANAIHDAVRVRLKELPMSPETLFWSLRVRDSSK